MRLIDADLLKLEIACVYGSNPQYINWLNHAPTVDAVPVVRCKDCKHYGNFAHCPMCFAIYSTGYEQKPDDYCSRAERKEE